MPGKIPPKLYWPDTVNEVIAKMEDDIMPAPFIRRMRLINVLSAIVLQKMDPELILPFSVEDLHHILDKQISQDAIIDQLYNKALAIALTTGELRSLWEQAKG